MKKLIALATGIALSGLVCVAAANAQTSSCSAAGANCRKQVGLKIPKASQPEWIAKCNGAEQTCKTSCSGGKSVFVSVVDGTQHPSSSCK
jgi:hypothetical protein